MADTLLTEGDTTTTVTEGDTTTVSNADDTTTVETFDADGNQIEGGEFDKEGKKIEVKEPELDDDGNPIEKKDGDDDKPEGAPESYEDFTLPEGLEISESDLSDLHDVAKDLDLSQDQAQKIVDLESKRAEARVLQAHEAFTKMQEDWVQELKDDKDFGGDNLDKNIGLAVKVINKFGSQELKDTLDKSGMGNNPDLIKLFNKIGRAISEDNLDDTGDNSGSESGKSLAERIYPNQNS